MGGVGISRVSIRYLGAVGMVDIRDLNALAVAQQLNA